MKACVDGWVDAGLWADDTPEYITTIEPALEVGTTDVTVTLTERGAP